MFQFLCITNSVSVVRIFGSSICIYVDTSLINLLLLRLGIKYIEKQIDVFLKLITKDKDGNTMWRMQSDLLIFGLRESDLEYTLKKYFRFIPNQETLL